VLDFAGEHENFTNKVNFLVHGTIFGLSVIVLFLFVVRCNWSSASNSEDQLLGSVKAAACFVIGCSLLGDYLKID
jgi:hypothetical protein